MKPNTNLWSCNEWDTLKEVIIGTAVDANIPHGDLSHHATNYANLSPEEYANIPKGKYPDIVYEEAEEDLFDNSAILLTPSASSVKEAVDLAFNFASIVAAVREGRTVYDNIK